MPAPAPPPTTLARVIAVVGCDGAGKSTLAADLAARLGAERPTAFLYLGQSSGLIGEAIARLPLIGPALGRYLRRRSTRAHRDETGRPPTPDVMTALVIHLLSRWRLHKVRRMIALDRGGTAVVTDRFPQAERPGFWFDGPGLDPAAGGGAIVRWLARREERLYRRMAARRPALLIRLTIDAATAHARKPDHRLAMLEAKARVIPTLAFNGSRILDLDGRDLYPEVLAAALAGARAALA